MLYILGFFCQLLLPNHIQKTYIYKHKTPKLYTIQNKHTTLQKIGCVCICQVTLQTTAIYVYEHLIYFCYLQFFFQL